MRGGHVSKPIEDLVKEVREFTRIGVKELIWLHRTQFIMDWIFIKEGPSQLLYQLAAVDGIEWIRLHMPIQANSIEIIDARSANPKYVIISTSRCNTHLIIYLWQWSGRLHNSKPGIDSRSIHVFPEIAIRTTFIVGFPEKQKKILNNCVTLSRIRRFERLGVFQYSHEEDTRLSYKRIMYWRN